MKTLYRLAEQHSTTIKEVWIEEESGYWGDEGSGYWVTLHSGWAWKGIHVLHEETIKEIMEAFKQVERCACSDCVGEAVKVQGTGLVLEEDLPPCPCCFPPKRKTYKVGGPGLSKAVKQRVSCYVQTPEQVVFLDRGGYVWGMDQDGKYRVKLGRATAMFNQSEEIKVRRPRKKKKKGE